MNHVTSLDPHGNFTASDGCAFHAEPHAELTGRESAKHGMPAPQAFYSQAYDQNPSLKQPD